MCIAFARSRSWRRIGGERFGMCESRARSVSEFGVSTRWTIIYANWIASTRQWFARLERGDPIHGGDTQLDRYGRGAGDGADEARPAGFRGGVAGDGVAAGGGGAGIRIQREGAA